MKNIFLLLILCSISAQAMEVTFFNIGQGNCTLITKPGQKTMLLDAGFSKAPPDDPSCHKVIKQIVEKIKNSCPDTNLLVVASHADKDHINLMAAIGTKLIAKKFTLEFILGGSKEHYEKSDGARLLSFLNENKKDSFYTFVGSIPEKVRMARLKKRLPDYCEILAAEANDNDINNTSIVIRAVDGEFSAFLSGDATSKVTNTIPTVTKKSASNGIQQLSHHGSDTHDCTSDALVADVDATAFIISAGNTGQPLYHPRFDPINSASKFCIKKGLTEAPYHILTHAHEYDIARKSRKNPEPTLKIIPYISDKVDPNFHRVANYNNGFCAAVTSLPIYSTADSGTITCTEDNVSTSHPNNTNAELSLCVLKGINNPNFTNITHLTLNNMGINSAQLKKYFSNFPKNLNYFDLRNNKIGLIGIEHLLVLYKDYRHPLIVKIAKNLKIKKDELTEVCEKEDVKAITAENRIYATFSKKDLASDTIESLEFSRNKGDNHPPQHMQAKAYAENNSAESHEAKSNTVKTFITKKSKAKKIEIKAIVQRLSHDKDSLFINKSDDAQNSYSYEWPGIIDICLLSDPHQTVAGITTKANSTLFDFENNTFKKLKGFFKYTNPKKPWKTIGKEFWTLDEPGVSYYHERTPFSNHGKFVMTVSAANKTLNIYEIDPLVFDPQHVKLHKSISEEDLKNDLGHSIDEIKRVAFTDNDHSVKINFTDKTHGELRYILEPN